jgi:hypothetical protein
MNALKLRVESVRHAAERRAAGYIDAVMAAAVQSTAIHLWIDREDFDRIRIQFAGPCGPGCQLKKSLAWWGIKDDGSCGCSDFAAMMDAWGCDECWRRLEEIVEHLRTAAAEKGLQFIATAARIMVGRAIEAARKEVAHATQEGQEEAWTNLVRAR